MDDVSIMLVTLDSRSYFVKPTDQGALTNRLISAGGTEIDAAKFCDHVREGKSWAGGVFEKSNKGWGRFLSQQLFGIDFDNEAPGETSGTKRRLNPDDSGYLDPLDAIRRCSKLNLEPMCLYFTFGAMLEPLHYKYRLVFDMGEPITDKSKAESVIATLLSMFPEADQKCRNVNRIFYGSCGEVVELWRLRNV